MKHFIYFVVFLSMAANAVASTNINTSSVSGHWTLSGSPYLIGNNITVDSAQSLTIDPGVSVIFQGPYEMDINGSLIAQGNASQVINFQINDTTGWSDTSISAGGWHGITFSMSNSAAMTDVPISYCNFSDIKGGMIGLMIRSMKFSNCNFFHNLTLPGAYNTLFFVGLDTLYSFELDSCSFYNNLSVKYTGIITINGNGNSIIHNCTMYNNTSETVMFTWFTNLLFSNNQVYNNTQLDTIGAAATLTVYYGNASIRDNKIYGNNNMNDGALVCYQGLGDICGNYVCGNKSHVGYTGSSACGASEGGGGIRLSSNNSTSFYTVRNNVIANNYAAFEGGAIYIYWVSASIYNNQIVNNLDGNTTGGINIFNSPTAMGPSKVTIKNNLFYNNYSEDTSTWNHGLYNVNIGAGDTVEFNHNWEQNTFSIDVRNLGFGYTSVGDTSGLIGTDPGLIDPTTVVGASDNGLTKDFRLLSTSPCIDMGDATGLNEDTVDYWGDPRIYGSAIDIGAYEYKPAPNSVPVTPAIYPMTVYPNPVKNIFFISTPGAYGTLELSSAAGILVAKQTVANTITSFDVHALAPGIYFINWRDSGTNSRQAQKIIIE